MGSNYVQKFHRHIRQFMDSHGLWPQGGEAWVALSGGVDSMALLHVLASFRRKQGLKLKALTIDHCSREESARDVEFCQKQCEHLGVPFWNQKLSEKFLSNREHRWRQGRQKICQTLLAPGEVLYQGHHLNDSFEWYLMGQLKSSSSNIVGIPLIHSYSRRPFLCVSKSQILLYAQKRNISFVQDVSNQDQQFERNYLRHSISSWERRFPKYLKHYAQRQNDWAHQQSAHTLKRRGHFYHRRDEFGGQLFWSWGKLGGTDLKRALIKGICQLSSQDRGQLSKEVEKLLAAQQGSRLGPMTFSGGVGAYWDRQMIYLRGHKGPRWQEEQKNKLQQQWKTYNGPQELKTTYTQSPELLTFPLYLAHPKVRGMALSTRHPLYGPWINHSLGSENEGFWASPLRLIGKSQQIHWPVQLLEFRLKSSGG